MYPEENDPDLYRPTHRSHAMELAAFLFAVLSILSCLVFYIAVPCGALSILFAFLSRGKAKKLRGQTRFAAILGAAGMASSLLLSAYMFYQLYHNPYLRSQVRVIFNQYAEQYGLDLDFDSLPGMPSDGNSEEVPDSTGRQAPNNIGQEAPYSIGQEAPDSIGQEAPDSRDKGSGQPQDIIRDILDESKDNSEQYYDSSRFWEDLFSGKVPSNPSYQNADPQAGDMI